MSRTAVILFTHFFNRNILDMFTRLRRESPEGYDVYIALNLIDDPLEAPKEAASVREALFLCSHETLRSLPYPEKCKPGGWSGTGWLSSDNVDTIMLSFHRSHPDYDYYWGIEYDVHYEGKWGFLFDRFAGSTADLLATTLYNASKVPFKKLMPPFADDKGTPIRYDDAIVGFFPLYRVSRRFLEKMDGDYCAGFNGHYEFTWGTTALRHGLEIEDIGGDGPYTKPHNRNVFYFNTIGRWDVSPGTFVFRPAFTKVPRHENTLWHPVKPGGSYHNHMTTTHEGSLESRTRYLVKRILYPISIWLWFRRHWRPATSSPVGKP